MSKQIVSMARLTGQLERMFRAINHDFFNDELDMPTITVVPTARAYAHVSVEPIWECGKDTKSRELNISSSYLNRGLEYICASLIHEGVHLLNLQHNVADTSRGGTYHPKVFKVAAEEHGLICTRTEKYGWADTSSVLSDRLLDWVLLHDEFREIELCRTTPGVSFSGIGGRAAEGGAPTPSTRPNHNHRYVCPHCHNIARSGKPIRLICGDCLQPMIEG